MYCKETFYLMKFKSIAEILIWSENWQPLADWYQSAFGLSVVEESNHPLDTGRLMAFPEGEAMLWVGQHSQIKGKNQDPNRLMVDINVDSVQEAFEYLKKQNLPVIAKPFQAPSSDLWFATLSDPDGNTLQVIGPR